MDLLNRVIIILVILCAMILIPLALIFPEQAQFTLQYVADVIQANLAWLYSLTPGAQLGMRIMLAVAGMMAFCIGLLLLALEVIRIRRNTVKLKDGSGEIIMNGVAGHLAYYVDLLPDVLRVKPSVKSTGKGVRTTLYVETAPGINVPQKSGEISQTARQVLEEQLGLQVKGDIRVVIRPVPYPRTRQGKRPTAIAEHRPALARAGAAEPDLAHMGGTPPVEAVEPPEEKPLHLPEDEGEAPSAPEAAGTDSDLIEVKASPPEPE
jgi:hypothetical protein